MQVPRLETERLVLRAHRGQDFSRLCAMWSDPLVTRYIGVQPSTQQQSWSRLLVYAGHWAIQGFGYWAVEEKSSGLYIGELGFADFKREISPSIEGIPEIGWALMPEFHGLGYATEGLRKAIEWADSELQAPRTVCLISPENAPSQRVAAKLGYREKLKTVLKHDPTVLYERLSTRT